MNRYLYQPSSKNEAGFTIMEVLIAILIFSIGILAVAKMQVQSLEADKRALEQTEATMYASNLAETLIELPDDSAQLSDGTTDSINRGVNDKYKLDWTVNNSMAGGGFIAIQIVVTWQGKGGSKRLVFDFARA